MKDAIDYVLLGLTAILVFLGTVVLATVSAPFSLEKTGSASYFLIHQIMWGLIPGIILGVLAFKIPLEFIRKNSLNLLIINLILLGCVFLPKIGVKMEGASRWISLGGIHFQPSELLKLSFIFYLSAWLSGLSSFFSSERKSKLKWKNYRFSVNEDLYQTLVPFLIITGVIGLLLAIQPDVSTLGVIVLTAGLMYFAAGTPISHSFLIVLAGIGFVLFLIKTAPYRINRILVFLKPETEPLGIGYQIKQALIAVGSGGILGVGLGMSRQKFGFLPQSIGDSIFAIFCEETGFIGALILISLFIGFAWQGFKIAKLSQDSFSRFVALGITCWITIQGFINISSMIGILPLTGIPLPFISYGGSHLITELIGVGILLNISQRRY